MTPCAIVPFATLMRRNNGNGNNHEANLKLKLQPTGKWGIASPYRAIFCRSASSFTSNPQRDCQTPAGLEHRLAAATAGDETSLDPSSPRTCHRDLGERDAVCAICRVFGVSQTFALALISVKSAPCRACPTEPRGRDCRWSALRYRPWQSWGPKCLPGRLSRKQTS